GAQTARADNPQLTVRLPNHDGRQPLRCVVTASGKLDPSLGLFCDGAAETVVFCPEGVPGPSTARTIPMPPADAGVELEAVLRWLAEHGVNDLLVEGGAQLNAALLRARLVDRVSVFVAPKLFGAGPSGFGELNVADPSEAVCLEEMEVAQIGEDWLFRGRPARRL